MSREPAVSFTAFVVSLAATAAVHFGDVDDPSTGSRQPDLAAARRTIDLIAMLEEKTRGNLTIEERRLVEQVLYELRLRYVDATRASGSGAGS